MDFYHRLRPLIYRLTPEQAHRLTISLLHLGGMLAPWMIRALFPVHRCGPEVKAFGLTFPNPLGMAAGYDKDATAWRGLAQLGFGHIELGTVTPRPQPGNPKPRLFRLVEHEAIINRMGFNNVGVEQLLRNVGKSSFRGVLGINIGKNFDTPIERAADDYLACLEAVYDRATYVAVNISSPNTKNLRQLQGESELDGLLGPLKREQAALAQQHGRHVQLALKIAPDLDEAQLKVIADALRRHRIDAAIATHRNLAFSPLIRSSSQRRLHARPAQCLVVEEWFDCPFAAYP